MNIRRKVGLEMEMKLYRVIRKYGTINILDMVFAENEEQVYKIMDWECGDKPELFIEEEVRREGCILSIPVVDGRF